MPPFDCAVVGAGIHGLCTAFSLRTAGVARVVVLDQFGPGHAHGSSHGATRITRSSYDEPAFVALAQAAGPAWSELERRVGQRLREPTPGVFFGPRAGPIAGYAAATRAAGVAVHPLPLAAARARFALLAFDDDDDVLLDETAGVVLAAATMSALREWLAAHDVEFRWHTRVTGVAARPGGIELATTGASIAARHAVLACGPWSGRLRAAPAPLLALRQQVGYFAVNAPAAACAPGTFPVWARIGHAANDFSYGLPSLGGSGLKLGLHRTAGAADDPGAAPPAADRGALLELARSRFACAVTDLVHTETCFYTMAPGHQLLVERAQDLPLTTIAACSGHAFKFGPVIGRRAAALAGA